MKDPRKDGTAWHPFQPWAIIVIAIAIIGACAGATIAAFLLKK